MFLFADGQTTERTVVPAERLGRALGVPMRVLPDRGELIVEIESTPFTDRSHEATWRGHEQGCGPSKRLWIGCAKERYAARKRGLRWCWLETCHQCPHYGGLRCSPEPVVGGGGATRTRRGSLRRSWRAATRFVQ